MHLKEKGLFLLQITYAKLFSLVFFFFFFKQMGKHANMPPPPPPPPTYPHKHYSVSYVTWCNKASSRTPCKRECIVFCSQAKCHVFILKNKAVLKTVSFTVCCSHVQKMRTVWCKYCVTVDLSGTDIRRGPRLWT